MIPANQRDLAAIMVLVISGDHQGALAVALATPQLQLCRGLIDLLAEVYAPSGPARRMLESVGMDLDEAAATIRQALLDS